MKFRSLQEAIAKNASNENYTHPELGHPRRTYVRSDKNELACMLIEYGDPSLMVAKEWRDPDAIQQGPYLNENYTRTLMDIIDKVGLFDSPEKSSQCRTPMPN